MSSQLAYFKDFAGDRSGEFSNDGGGFTSVSGGPSARLLISSTPLLAIQLETGSSDARQRYTRKHGHINFAAEERYEGFSLTHRCVVPPPGFTTGILFSHFSQFLPLIPLTLRCFLTSFLSSDSHLPQASGCSACGGCSRSPRSRARTGGSTTVQNRAGYGR